MAGTSYQIAVDGYYGDVGAIALNITDPLLVTNPNNSGPGSLRAALEYANSNPDATAPATLS